MGKTFSSAICIFLIFLTAMPADAIVMVDTGPGQDDSRARNIQATLSGTGSLGKHSILTEIEGWFTTRTVSTIYLSVFSEGGELPSSFAGGLPEGFTTTLDSISAQEFEPSVNASPDWYGLYDIQWVLNNWGQRPLFLKSPRS